MILDNLTRAFKTQNWLAVATEFVIVIAGVVIGFQINAWNEARAERVDEVRLLSQLRADVDAAIASKRDWIEFRRASNADLAAAISIIQDPQGGDALSQAQCNVVWQSHIVIPSPSRLTTLEEILSTRGLDSLSDMPLRRALLAYRGEMEEIREVYVFIREDFATVVDDFATAMPRRLDTDAGTYDAVCRLDIMQASPALQNQLISNYGRADGLASLAEHELALLEAVRDAVWNTAGLALGEDADPGATLSPAPEANP